MKIAVIKKVSPLTAKYHTGNIDADIIKIGFYSKYPSLGLAANVEWTPRELYLDIKNRKFDFTGGKAKKYGAIQSVNGGSFNDFFLTEKQEQIISLLKNNGWEIIQEEIA